MSCPEPAGIFTRSWSLYDLLTEHNYMFHREIYAGIDGLMRLRHDSSYRTAGFGLRQCTLPGALPEAHAAGVVPGRGFVRNGAGRGACVPCGIVRRGVLTQGDLLEAVESTAQSWDVLFTGFALHHLMPEQKARFFQAVGRCLADKGWFILVDVVREENQDRESYLEGYLQFMREKWTAVPGEQLEEACAHVREHDHPESLSTLREMARQAGLIHTHLVSRHAQHHTLLFSRHAVTAIPGTAI